MKLLPRFEPGYYWARDDEIREAPFVALLDGGHWYVPGVAEPLKEFDPENVICPVKRPVH